MTLAVNGRFLRSPRPTGIHRVARGLLDAARAAGGKLEVLVPPGIADPRADRTVWGPPGRFGDQVWEQVNLPLATRGLPLVSLINTAPVAKRDAAVMVHDLAFRYGPQWYSRTGRAYGAVVMAGARRARVVLTVSRTIAGELAAAGIASDRIVVVPVAVDDRVVPAPAEVQAEARQRLGLERPFLLVVGWANPRKDVATVIRAHLDLVTRIPHDLVLCGAESPTFRQVDIPREPSIRLLSYVSDQDLVALMTAAEGFLYPSLYEGFGLPPLEALRCGTPAIVSDIPVLRESTAGAAALVPPGEVEAWRAAMERALRGELRAEPPPAWTWADSGRVFLEALQPLA